MNEDQLRALVVEYNDSASPYPADKTIVALFEEQVARTPNDEAIRFGEQSLTYSELNDRANRWRRISALWASAQITSSDFVWSTRSRWCTPSSAYSRPVRLRARRSCVPERARHLQCCRHAAGQVGTLPVLVTQSRFANSLPSGAHEW